jgi:hypothetical protein
VKAATIIINMHATCFLPAAKIPPGAAADGESIVEGNVFRDTMSTSMEDVISPAEWSAELMVHGAGIGAEDAPLPFDAIEYSATSTVSEDGSSECSNDIEESDLEKFLMDAFMDVPEISV